jgi:serine/threonine protein phosphatase 1
MGRLLAIGDIHGCFDALMTLVDTVGLTDQDKLVTLGDYVNRGPDTRKVVDWLIQRDNHRNLIALRGNHEIMMLSHDNSPDHHRRWLQVGGTATLTSYAPIGDGGTGDVADIPPSHWQFLRNRLLSYYQTKTHLFVHANLYSDMDLKEQPDYMLFWEKFGDPPRHQSGKVMVCGHTTQKSGLPLDNGNAICIDTWAYGDGGWLTCLDVSSRRIWQANQKGQTRGFFLGEKPAE